MYHLRPIKLIDWLIDCLIDRLMPHTSISEVLMKRTSCCFVSDLEDQTLTYEEVTLMQPNPLRKRPIVLVGTVEHSLIIRACSNEVGYPGVVELSLL